MPSDSVAAALARQLQKMGYVQPVVVKLADGWSSRAFDPLNKIEVEFNDLGTSRNAAILKLSTLPAVPKHYVCGSYVTCKACGAVGKPVGYTQGGSGDFMHRCQSCGSSWVAMTATQQEEQAKALMDEALVVLDPAFRRMVSRRTEK